MAKHGAEMHFVRPDFVYRTSVLQAIPGYQPVSNAQEIAARFTSAPYFATTLSGLGQTMPVWERIKLRWQAWRERTQAKRIAKQVAALAPTTARPPGQSYADALPPATYPADQRQQQYSNRPGENMANVGLQITAGIVQTGDDIMPPGVARTEFTAAGQIDPRTAAIPGQMASMMQSTVPPMVGDAAYKAAMARWNGLRQMWWANLGR